MRTEKIVTIYPTVVKPGLAISHYMPPDPVFIADIYPSDCYFYLTSFMYIEKGKKYITELDVLSEGKSVLSDSHDDNSFETFISNQVNDTSLIVGSSLFIKNAKFTQNGAYEIKFRLFESVDEGLSDIIDEKTCGIISVSAERSQE